jgi:hypothetical protein
LVTDHVRILKTARDGSLTMMDAQAVKEKMGVRPDQVVDLLALWETPRTTYPERPASVKKALNRSFSNLRRSRTPSLAPTR